MMRIGLGEWVNHHPTEGGTPSPLAVYLVPVILSPLPLNLYRRG